MRQLRLLRVSSSAPAKAEAAATAGPSKAPSGGSAGDATTARGKSVFDSQGCGGCHGGAGVVALGQR